MHFQQFGRYRIVRKLGRSMTDVYLAHDPDSDSRVVLKIIEQLRDEFTQLVIEAERRGAQIQKQLHQLDPRILEIYDFGEQHGCFFVAMEYFEGRNIAELLQAEGRLDPGSAARYAMEVCSQLGTLHSFISDVNGRKTAVVHGDIKPTNIQIGPRGELRLLDFGIAKVITSTHNLTHHNLGSPTYCSPERISRAQVDPHADLWALGVSLYEMVGGNPPYQAQNTRKLENLIQARRPPRALPSACPDRLKAVIFKALAADIHRRYQTAADFESDLRAFIENRPTAAERESPQSWDSNATIEKSPGPSPPPRPSAPPWADRARKAWQSLRPRFAGDIQQADLGGVLATMVGGLLGLLLFIPLAYLYRFYTVSDPLRQPKNYADLNQASIVSDWTLYQGLKNQDRPLGRLSPVTWLTTPLRSRLLAAADAVIDRYRRSSETQITGFDWQKARLCLQHALEMDPSDEAARGKLALCDGYLNLIRNPQLPKAAESQANFQEAAARLPRSPDPHLALARLYVYSFRNVGQALAELHEAAQLGYVAGPREQEQQADGYLFHAEWALDLARRKQTSAEKKKWLSMARADIERARGLYEPIDGFSNVSVSLEQLDRRRTQAAELGAALDAAVAAAAARPRRPVKRNLSARRWP
ncbi:MAG TPA: serine/threonine-protein kinase [Bryobacteraceae bacterium]|nr:serine/threonine-protein kinase [Bryobacteraceae bacterium]